MRRIKIIPRPNWQGKVQELGLTYHSSSTGVYWNESAYYEFTLGEINKIEEATNDLHNLCLTAVQHIIDKNLFELLGINDWVIPLIKSSWEERQPAIYGRMDLAYDGKNIKLLEYNADTPTSLFEASVVQWLWRTEVFPDRDQFNSIEECLLAGWKKLCGHLSDSPLYFACVGDSEEDLITITYLRDIAELACIKSETMSIQDIGWDDRSREFRDLADNSIQNIFKLYPWEWLVNEPFGRNIPHSSCKIRWIEPIWKMLLSNKAILAVLWELYPDHPLLLPTFLEKRNGMTSYVSKPILSREGANVTVVENGQIIQKTDGDYDENRLVYQQRANIPCMDNRYPIIGSWVINGQACGMGIRESKNLVTDNSSSFVPHIINSLFRAE